MKVPLLRLFFVKEIYSCVQPLHMATWSFTLHNLVCPYYSLLFCLEDPVKWKCWAPSQLGLENYSPNKMAYSRKNISFHYKSN